MGSSDHSTTSSGTGPDGGTLACKLVPSGKKSLLLERGGYLRRVGNGLSNLAHQGLFH